MTKDSYVEAGECEHKSGLKNRIMMVNSQTKRIFELASGGCLTILRNPLFSIAVFSTLFLVTRYAFLIETPTVGISPDSMDYLRHADEILAGTLPELRTRVVGYPLFLALAQLVYSNNLVWIVVVQMGFTFASSTLLIISFYRNIPGVHLIVALGLGLCVCTNDYIDFETRILTESLFCSLLLLWSSCLVEAVYRPTVAKYALMGFLMAAIILVRSAGLFLLPIYALLLVRAVLTKENRSHVLAFCASLPTVLLSYCIYNWISMGSFQLTSEGGRNICYSAITLLDESSEYGDEMNENIRNTNAQLPLDEAERVYGSWDILRIGNFFGENYITDTPYRRGCLNAHRNNDRKLKQQYFQSSFDGIRNNPLIYSKIVLANMIGFARNSSKDQMDIRERFDRRAESWVSGAVEERFELYAKWGFSNPLGSGWVGVKTGKGFVVRSAYNVRDWLKMLYFKSFVYLWVFLGSMIWLLWCLRHPEKSLQSSSVTLVAVFSLVIFGKCLLVSLVEPPLQRYSYVVDVFFILIPILVTKEILEQYVQVGSVALRRKDSYGD